MNAPGTALWSYPYGVVVVLWATKECIASTYLLTGVGPRVVSYEHAIRWICVLCPVAGGACVLVQVNICSVHDSGLFSWLVCGYSTCQSCQFSASAFGARVLGLSYAQREGEKGRMEREKEREEDG